MTSLSTFVSLKTFLSFSSQALAFISYVEACTALSDNITYGSCRPKSKALVEC